MAQAFELTFRCNPHLLFLAFAMAPMKAITSMSKTAIAEKMAEKVDGIKKSQAVKVLNALADVGAEGLKNGKFTLPGLCMIKLRKKAATKATERMMFGQMQKIKAKPAKTVVKAFAVSALKKAF